MTIDTTAPELPEPVTYEPVEIVTDYGFDTAATRAWNLSVALTGHRTYRRAHGLPTRPVA